MTEIPVFLWAPIIGICYFIISWCSGDMFPFSRYPMYSCSPKRKEGAVPVFLADEAVAKLDGFTDFSGIDTEGLYPPNTYCSLEWMIHEAKRYFEGHKNTGEPGDIEVAWGFRHLTVDNEGNLTETLKLCQHGRARQGSGPR